MVITRMKFCIPYLTLAAIMLGGMQPLMAQANDGSAVSVPGAAAWQKPDKLNKQLAAEIRKRLPGLDAKQVQKFLKKKDNQRLLWMYHISCLETGMAETYARHNDSLKSAVQGKKDEIARLEKEVSSKSGPEKKNAQYRLTSARETLKELQAESKHIVNLCRYDVLKSILADAEWMEQILFTGEMERFSRVVEIIDSIAKEDPDALKKGVERDITTAVALEYARCNSRSVKAVDRAKYFLKYWRQGRLNASFDSLPMHHRRVACGWKPENRAGTITSLEWALNNVHVPDWQYPASCWRCGYILDNVFGDSIHGAYYFAPWEGVQTDNHMWLTKNVGGVCGGLSHFGAAAACANGVPALTAGEPGHCAYIVLVDGKWVPAYSLSWERGLHWNPWNGNHTYSSLHLTDDLYAESAEKKTRQAQAYRVLARLYQDAGDAEKALACYEQSALAAPLNYPMWREYASFLEAKMPQNAEAWKKLNASLCKGVASCYPEQAAELLKQFVYERMARAGLSAEDMADACAQFWKYADKMGPDRWYIENMANRQLQLCKQVGGESEENVIGLYSRVLAQSAPHDAYSGSMMAWGNNVANSLSEEGKNKLTEAMLEVLSKGKNIGSEQKAKLLSGLILSAEQSRDLTTFYALSKMVDPELIKGSAAIPDIAPFPGKLVSEGGLPFASSTSQWDSPYTHSGLVTKKGGRIHTARETNPWIAVKLPKHAYVTGVVFAGTNDWSLIGRFRPVKVQVSDTGRDDDWHDVGEPIPNTGNYIIRFNLEKERPKALYVRVLRPGGPEVFHANGIYVFGEPAA